MTFDELILIILHDNSGGVKMTTLITEVVVRAQELSKSGKSIEEFKELLLMKDGRSPFIDALDQKLEEMEAAGKLGLLHYGWPMGDEVVLNVGGLVREKTFIYLPVSRKCIPPLENEEGDV